MRHRRTALLSFTKKFFHFEDLGPLKMAKFSGPAIDTRCNHGEHRKELRVPVALHDLGGNRRRLQPKFVTDGTLDCRIEVGMRADRAAQFSDSNAFQRLSQSFFRASKLVKHQSKF